MSSEAILRCLNQINGVLLSSHERANWETRRKKATFFYSVSLRSLAFLLPRKYRIGNRSQLPLILQLTSFGDYPRNLPPITSIRINKLSFSPLYRSSFKLSFKIENFISLRLSKWTLPKTEKKQDNKCIHLTCCLHLQCTNFTEM